MGIDPTLIQQDETFPIHNDPKWDLYFSLLRTTLSGLIKDYATPADCVKALPILKADAISPSSSTFSVYLIAHARYSHGIGRYVSDALNAYLVPGKYTPILLSRSIRCTLKGHENAPLFFIEYLVNIPDPADHDILQSNLARLLKTIRFVGLGTRYIRRCIRHKKFSALEHELVLHESVQELFELSNTSKEAHFFQNIPKEHLKALSGQTNQATLRPIFADTQSAFTRAIFFELHQLFAALPALFFEELSQKHLVRLCCYVYLFRKVVTHSFETVESPKALCKFIPLCGHKGRVTAYGLVHVMALPEECIRFGIENILRICQKLVPGILKKHGLTFNADTAPQQHKAFYLEVHKKHMLPFTREDRKILEDGLLAGIARYLTTMESMAPHTIDDRYALHAKQLEDELLEKERLDDVLLARLTRTCAEKMNNDLITFASFRRAYYMVYALLYEQADASLFSTAAQTIDNHFIVGVCSSKAAVHKKVAYAFSQLEKERPEVITCDFDADGLHIALLFYTIETPSLFERFRSHLLHILQNLQLEAEELLKYHAG